MTKCAICKRQPTQRRKLDSENICSECKDGADAAASDIDDNKPMGDLTFGEFRTWFKCELNTLVRQIVLEELQTTKDDLEKLQKEHKDLEKKVGDFERRFEEKTKKMEKDITDNKEQCKKVNTVTNNNLKYLINLDRDRRKHNVVVFGVKEDEDLKIEGKTAGNDTEKTKLIIDFLGCSHVKTVDMFRLGKDVSDKPRPIKLTLASKDMAFSILTNAKKLKPLKDSQDLNIYCKPDKSKSEQNEFQRLGKKKAELLLQYPTPEGQDPRVTLQKGSLQVDSVEVDKYEPTQTLF